MSRIEVTTAPGVLIWARETAGLSLEDAAKKVHQEPSALRAIERGASKPTLGVAKELAHAYRRPLAALLLPTPPAEADKPADFRVGTDGRLGRETRLAIRRAERLQGLAAELFDALDNPSSWTRGGVSLASSPAEVAEMIRRKLPFSLDDQQSWKDEYMALRSWRDALGSTGVLVLQSRMPIDEVRGFSLATEGPITIVLNTADYVLARVFTLVHELTHQLLGSGGICLPDPGRVAPGGSQGEESYCNRVAGNVLVPGAGLRSDDLVARLVRGSGFSDEASLSRLARRYWVSRQVMWFRLREEAYVDEQTYRAQWGKWAARPTPSRAASAKPPQVSTARRILSEAGPRFVTSVLEAHDRGLLGLKDAVDFLGVSTQDLTKLEGLVAAPGA